VPAISLVIPCYNEAVLLPRLLTSVDAARRAFAGGPDEIEVIVSDNASTDSTAAIAAARGAILAFIDADSQVHPDTFNVIAALMRRAEIVGGSTGATMERWSAGIVATYAIIIPLVWLTNLDIGVVFCRRADFETIGGYDGSMTFAEDVKFLLALRRLGRSRRSRLVRARTAKVIASTRKFDRFGDWHYLTLIVKGPWYLISGRRRAAFADRYWYKPGR
jgi:glycosyltransferase involved in cell wall biosynthesis